MPNLLQSLAGVLQRTSGGTTSSGPRQPTLTPPRDGDAHIEPGALPALAIDPAAYVDRSRLRPPDEVRRRTEPLLAGVFAEMRANSSRNLSDEAPPPGRVGRGFRDGELRDQPVLRELFRFPSLVRVDLREQARPNRDTVRQGEKSNSDAAKPRSR